MRENRQDMLASADATGPMGAPAYDVVLLPTHGQVVEYRKRAAQAAARAFGGGEEASVRGSAAGRSPASGCGSVSRAGDPLFGTTVTTFDAWLADLWELYGDGRSLVTPVERAMAMTVAFEEAREELPASVRDAGRAEAAAPAAPAAAASAADGLMGDSPASGEAAREGGLSAVRGFVGFAEGGGTANMAARCARQAAGLREFDGAVAAAREGSLAAFAPQLESAEAAFLGVMARYFDLLDGLGLVEPGSALAALPQAMPADRHLSVLLEGFPPPGEQRRRFFAACPWLRATERPAPGAEGIAAPPEGVDVRFAFPSGRYARPRLLVDLVGELHGRGLGRVVLACKDAPGTYAGVAAALEREGRTCALRARARFGDTDFGRVLFALHRLATDGAACREDLADVLFSPIAGVPVMRARRIDAELRADRLADPREKCAELRAASETFSYLEDLASDPEAAVVAGALEDAIRALPGVSEAYRHEQLAALGTARECLQAASRLGAGAGACMAVLAQASVDVSRAGTSGVGVADADVLVCDLAFAATLPSRSCDVLVLCDMTSACRPVADREDAGTALLGKLGIRQVDDALSQARREFRALEGVPTAQLVIERCLFDAAAEPTYPAMVVEELVDCYRDDPSATDDIDNPYLLPPALRRGMLERGEERLYENLGVARGEQPVATQVERPPVGTILPERRPLVVLPRRGKDGQAARPCLSASQIESYLACPYLWFVQRRLRAESLDEEFGPLQMGDFAHRALDRFYEAFSQKTGLRKVTPESLLQAREVMSAVLAEQEAAQQALSPSDNRLVPRTELEAREVDALKANLVRYLDFEAQLLPGFRPLFREYEVGTKESVEYAGVRLAGRIDRIDVDGAGRAVVIDYKGSLSADYEPFATEGRPPAKVQTLVYAQVVKRLLGLDVVGALYVSYGRAPKVAGAYDGRVLETPHLPNMRYERCACPPEGERSFARLLDETEKWAASAVRALLAGQVDPAPAGPASCAWCPVTACLSRED